MRINNNKPDPSREKEIIEKITPMIPKLPHPAKPRSQTQKVRMHTLSAQQMENQMKQNLLSPKK